MLGPHVRGSRLFLVSAGAVACTVRTASHDLGRARGSLEGNAVKLTVDSSEPLEDAIRVIGSLYGVTLVVSEDGREAGEPIRGSTTSKKRSVSDKPRSGVRVPGASSSKSATAVAGSDGPASNADIRSWARHAGLAVNGRGRVPASVMAEYREAHG